jgi:hypothetical protein
MSTRRLRARLDRLTQPANSTMGENKDRACDFTIDPALAKALRYDRKRLDELQGARPFRWPPTNEGETEEERTLRARIVERARTISCPAGYGSNEVLDDQVRLSALQSKTELPPWFSHLAQNDVEDPDAEEAQLIARIEAFNQTPEGRAQNRINELVIRSLRWMSPAEHSELDSLLTLYPEPLIHPKDPMRDAYVAWRRAALGDRKLAAQQDKLLAEKANFLHRRNKGENAGSDREPQNR